VGHRVLIDDGNVGLRAIAKRADELVCRCEVGGAVSDHKGINLPDSVVSAPALTDKDLTDLDWAIQHDLDLVGLSFVRHPDDLSRLHDVLDRGGGSPIRVIAKIEKPQALENIEAIIDAADGIMVARGDLGVEMDLPAVPIAQKRITRLCQRAGKPCIVATQMLESMIHSPTPTRAEVSDVANAVLDQADAVMLSGETAVGEYPVQAVEMMNRIARAVEAAHDPADAAICMPVAGAEVPAAIASAVRELMSRLDIAAVAVFTISGATARLLSKSRLNRPILAMSPEMASVRRMCLYYGVVAAHQTEPPVHTRDILAIASRLAVEQRLARSGQLLLVISGRPIGEPGNTNTLVVHTIP